MKGTFETSTVPKVPFMTSSESYTRITIRTFCEAQR
ncbi:hypothetical protein KALB_8275 [Kutzneria albida DSM 43870]|uniref:Uncharacterized protein n=1 Tax=Kutzneria albida DSM 43870 TaxID=1449976 RepID=W5WM92_9PSEU|nr:hypothetical protein KALB_8275 [Kutzneria albida DSM 43870]